MAMPDDIQLIVGREDVSAFVEAPTWSSADPGGFETASMQFQRKLRVPRGTDVKIIYGNSIGWEGRVNEVNRQLSAMPQTQLACQGYGARYKENGGSMIFVDRDANRWSSMSAARRQALYTSSAIYDAQVVPDTARGFPSIVQEVDGEWDATHEPLVETLYDAGPTNLIAKIYAEWEAGNNNSNASWDWRIWSMADDQTLTENSGANLNPSVAGATGSLTFTPTAARRYMMLKFFWNSLTANNNPGIKFAVMWRNVAIFGDHGIAIKGAAPGGVTPDDVASWVQRKAYPLATIGAGVIESSAYIIPQLAYYTPVPWEQMIDDAAKIAGFHYGTWEGPTLHFRSYPGTPSAWIASKSVDDLQLNDSLDGLFNVAKISWRDPSGTSGVATCTRSIAALDEGGITRTLFMDIGLGTALTATAFGNIVLAISERNAATTGSFVTRLPVIAKGGDIPAFMLKPGIDRLKVTDLTADGDGQTEFIVKRIEASVNGDGISTNVEMGRGADLIEALQARLQAGLPPLGLG